MPPWQGGGNMIADVTFEKTVYQPPPGASRPAPATSPTPWAGRGARLRRAHRHENIGATSTICSSLRHAPHGDRPGVRLVGTARDKASVLSFVLDGYTTEEVGKALNQEGIAVRTGHHCAQPILRRFGARDHGAAVARVLQHLRGAR
jgi:cysteine desulfurase/selenocysteine lyase